MQFFESISSKVAAALLSVSFSAVMLAAAIVPATHPVLPGVLV